MRFAFPAARKIATLKSRLATEGVPIIYVNDNFGRWRSDFEQQVERCLEANAAGRAITELLRPDPADYFVLKPKHSSFYSTTLEVLLQHLEVKKIIIVGFATDIRVLYTANDAYMRGLGILVPSDCVAPKTLQAKNQALNQMKRFLKTQVLPSSGVRLPNASREKAEFQDLLDMEHGPLKKISNMAGKSDGAQAISEKTFGLNHSDKRITYMNSRHLTNYLKDHFAGSVAALELLDHLISSHRGKVHEEFFIQLRREIDEDQEVLSGQLHDLDTGGGPVRNTTAFLGEKLTRIKLLLEDPSGGQLARLEKLEALALGIDGKRALWRSLLAIAEEIPALRKLDLARLDQRAEDQRRRVEKIRIEAARQAFVPAKCDG